MAKHEEMHLDLGGVSVDEEWLPDLPADNLPGILMKMGDAENPQLREYSRSVRRFDDTFSAQTHSENRGGQSND